MNKTITLKIDIVVPEGQDSHLDLITTEYKQVPIFETFHTITGLRPAFADAIKLTIIEYCLQHGIKARANVR